MTIELQALLAVTAILFVLLVIQGALVPVTHGFGWGLGPRDEPRSPSVMQGRASRIVANHLEGMALFVPLVVVAAAAGVSTPLTQTGALVFAAARAAFAVIYFFGVPVLRSAAWGVSVLGLAMIAFDLVRAGV